MSNAISRRLGRRFTAMGAGAALVAAGLSLGGMAPANAADSLVVGNVVDAQGNPLSGYVEARALQPDGTYDFVDFADADFGHFELTVPDGTYKFEFTSYSNVSEWYLDKADEATADAVIVGGGLAALAPWTVEQPKVVGAVVDPSGNPVSGATVYAYDAVTESFRGADQTDDKGGFAVNVGTDPVKLFFTNTRFAQEWYADKPTFATADAVTGSPAGANVGVVTLNQGGALTGQVTSDAGVPLEFVRVSADGPNSSSDLTDATGTFVIDNLDPGSYDLQFSDPLNEYASEFYNNVADSASATPVEVGIGQVVPVNANMTPLPAPVAKSVEATGVVKDDLGAPVVGAIVQAYSTPANPGDRVQVEQTRSNRAGVYVLDDLDQVAGENQFKLFGSAQEQGDDNAFSLFGRWFGGQQSYDRAAALTTTPPTPVGADIVLARAGGIAGTVSGVPGLPFGGSVTVFSADGTYFDGAGTEADKTFKLRSLPAGSYKVSFADFEGFHAPEWWNDTTFAKAVEVEVKPGQLTTGLDAVLAASLNATERPEIDAYPWVGKSITATRGEWNVETGTTYSYEWLVGSTVVGTGPSFTPTTSQIGDKLTFRVTAENGRLVGSATSGSTVKVGYKPKVKVKVKGGKATFKIKANPVKAKKVKGTVVVKEIVKVKDDGTIKYKKIAKTKIKKGKGTASLKKLKKKGKHKLVFFFTGKGKVGSNDVTKKVKVKR